ncbi:hypothetical protein Ae201684P_015699 [Aphanomyces euteiches]|nr:hypothetical protein Ae201684P_015699 [Aphanomyces euteiches]
MSNKKQLNCVNTRSSFELPFSWRFRLAFVSRFFSRFFFSSFERATVSLRASIVASTSFSPSIIKILAPTTTHLLPRFFAGRGGRKRTFLHTTSRCSSHSACSKRQVAPGIIDMHDSDLSTVSPER